MSGFTVYPAIDLRDGRCVRLKQGDFDRQKEYDADPVERAREWERQGARAIHIVDLDGAREGRPVQIELVRRIAEAVNIPIQLGGGIRTLEDLCSALHVADRVVMGTAAILDRGLRRHAVMEAGEALIVAVDARNGVVATHGWREESGLPVLEIAAELSGDGISSVLYTDVSRDGMDAGAALESTAEVARIIPAIASGGVRGVADMRTLAGTPGVIGAVVGTALYEGRVTLGDLLVAAGRPV